MALFVVIWLLRLALLLRRCPAFEVVESAVDMLECFHQFSELAVVCRGRSLLRKVDDLRRLLNLLSWRRLLKILRLGCLLRCSPLIFAESWSGVWLLHVLRLLRSVLRLLHELRLRLRRAVLLLLLDRLGWGVLLLLLDRLRWGVLLLLLDGLRRDVLRLLRSILLLGNVYGLLLYDLRLLCLFLLKEGFKESVNNLRLVLSVLSRLRNDPLLRCELRCRDLRRGPDCRRWIHLLDRLLNRLLFCVDHRHELLHRQMDRLRDWRKHGLGKVSDDNGPHLPVLYHRLNVHLDRLLDRDRLGDLQLVRVSDSLFSHDGRLVDKGALNDRGDVHGLLGDRIHHVSSSSIVHSVRLDILVLSRRSVFHCSHRVE